MHGLNLHLYANRSAKATKMEQWRTRRAAPETRAQFTAAGSHFLWQISQFLYQAPVSLAAKEISRGTIFILCMEHVAVFVYLILTLFCVYL